MHFDSVFAKLILFVGFQCTFIIPLFLVRNFCFGVFFTSSFSFFLRLFLPLWLLPYKSQTYMKAFASYKVTTKHVENRTLWFFTYISEILLSTAEVDISWKALKKAVDIG